MNRKVIFTLLLLVMLFLAVLIAGEIIARLFTSSNPDGQVYFKQKRLLPYRFPAEMTRYKIDAYREDQEKAYTVDHPLLGWTIGNGRDSENGLYHSNSQGLRSSPREYSLQPHRETLRIALFGDSFTHGDEEPWFNTWAYFLEQDLRRMGIRAEVLNFGVGGYGFSQAFLRWKIQGKKYRPDLVVIGFQGENMKRTVNIFRSLYSERTWLVFSKPRFIITPEGLKTVNCPVIPPEEVADYLANLDREPLARYEFWYNPDNYRAPFWTASRLGQLIYNLDRQGKRDRRSYSEMENQGGTPEEVTLAIIRSWAKDVRREKGIPIIVHLPRKGDRKLIAAGQKPAYYSLLEDLERDGIPVVDPAGKMKDRRGLYRRSHYSTKGNRIIAETLAEWIGETVREQGWTERFRCEPAARDDETLLARVEPDGTLDLDLGRPGDELFIRGGFHERELYQNRISARWTSGTARIRLPLSPPAGDRGVLEVDLAAAGPGDSRLEASLDGTGLVALEGGELRHRYRLPRLERAEVSDLILGTRAWNPAEVGNPGDGRRLGVMIDRIRVRAAPSP